MQVLEYDHERPLRGERLEQPARRPLHLLDRPCLLGGADRAQDQAGDLLSTLVGGEMRGKSDC
jgi:hypothetical protein